MAYAFNNLVQRFEMMADHKQKHKQRKKFLGTNASREQSCWGKGWIFYKDLYTNHYPLAVISIIPSGFAPVLVFHVFKVFNYSLKTEKRKKNYFEKATENGIMGSKNFWSTVFFHQKLHS